MHQIAFQDDPLGNDFFAFYENVENIKVEDLYEFVNKQFVGSKMILGGASVQHEKFVEHAGQAFAHVPVGTPENPVANYTGGTLKVPHYSVDKEAYYAIGWKCPGWGATGTPEKLALLQKIIGGGKAFSSGGPGKGMFSRMYRGVLSSQADFRSAECFASVRGDIGLFAIHGSCEERYLPELQQSIVQEIVKLLIEPIPAEELARGKVQLKTSIFYNLESRAILCEDMSRQVSVYKDKRDQPETSCANIDAITSQDLQDILYEMLCHPVSVVAMAPPKILAKFPDNAARQYFHYVTSNVKRN